jgi:hypothetical protein
MEQISLRNCTTEVLGLRLRFLCEELPKITQPPQQASGHTGCRHSVVHQEMVMDYAKPEVMIFVFLAVASIALYSYLSVHSYVNGRRKEREAYYKNETVRRLTESQGAGADAAIALLREEDRLQTRRRLEGTKLGGLITTGVGLGLMIFLGIANDDSHLIGVAIGVVPLMVGLALLIYAYRLAPREL